MADASGAGIVMASSGSGSSVAWSGVFREFVSDMGHPRGLCEKGIDDYTCP
jgi:hypothetical protein